MSNRPYSPRRLSIALSPALLAGAFLASATVPQEATAAPAAIVQASPRGVPQDVLPPSVQNLIKQIADPKVQAQVKANAIYLLQQVKNISWEAIRTAVCQAASLTNYNHANDPILKSPIFHCLR